MNIKPILCAALLALPILCNAQSTKIDTIPFTLSKKLLVFAGNINGVPVDFAFDTGAQLGVANAAIEEKTNFKTKNRSKGVKDANLNNIKLKKITIQQLSMGSHQFNDIKSVLVDMEYLQCNQLYLLGMDVIGKLNWRINFATKTLQVSATAFAVDSSFIALPISYKSNRPVTNISLGNQPTNKCLIDFGFTGVIDMPESDYINAIFKIKQQQGMAIIGLSSAMALSGLAKADTVKNMKIDSIFIGNVLFKNVPSLIYEKTDLKIGVGFFATYCTEVILNHSNDMYYYSKNNSPANQLLNFDARITYTNGKLIITAKNLSANSSATALFIGEEIKSVDGKLATDFKDNCEFLNSYYLNTNNQLLIEKTNGEKYSIKRQQIN